MDFVKMHGLGNDFICLDHFLLHDPMDYSEIAVRACHRRFGIGADGLLVILASDKADARMRIFNPDGSEPEMCGNGIRCFARYVYDRGYVKKKAMTIETLAGILSVNLEISEEEVVGVTVNMGEPCLVPGLIPVLAEKENALNEKLIAEGQEFLFSAVSMGNPHCVIIVDDLDALLFESLGPAIEKHPLFPKKTNVEFVRIDNPQEITVKVWERGAGPTLACGTGACACVVAAVSAGKTQRNVTVHLPGGDLEIAWNKDNTVDMTGPAVYVFEGKTLENR
ncbi:diaminopimelate epimerase [Dehalobacter sp. DCM]|uniref:diaminopimelate epimerase n=1 Tax=Dehalobacter sp. DCM TaxID=2907827 RepID=UPI00308126CC|nr:diaminopimelate epimerase [Dehalobacter sp. DCM]